MEPTCKQREAIEASGNVAVTAGAGTGKTAMLAARYVHHIIKDKFSPLEIVAVTFTDKAAAELRARIRAELLKENGEEAAAQVDAAQISTIHSLAARICRDFYDIAGLPADFGMLDETDAEILVADWFDEALAEVDAPIVLKLGYTWLRTAIRTLLSDPPAAEEALRFGNKQYIEHIANRNEQTIMALMQSDCWREAMDVLTNNHGKAGDLLEPRCGSVRRAMEDISARKNVSTAVADIIAVDLRGGAQGNWPTIAVQKVKDCIKSLKANLNERGAFADVALDFGDAEKEMYARVCLLRDAFSNVREYIQNAKRERRVLDFADLEHYALKALEHDAVRKHYAARWRAILIDEFQDTNPVQEKILKALSKSCRLTIVGDGKQSIYGFRRADPRVIKRFRKLINNDIVLDKTFRTHEGLVKPLNKIFELLLADSHEPLEADRKDLPHEAPFLEAHSFCEEGCDIESMRHVESSYVAAEIRRIIDSGLQVWDKKDKRLRAARWADIAILSRTRAPLDLYIEHLLEAGIPAVNTGGGDLLETRTAKDMIAILRFMSDTRDDVALVSVLRSPFFAVSDSSLQRLAAKKEKEESWWHLLTREHDGVERAFSELERMLGLSRSMTAVELIRTVDKRTGYTAVISNLEQGERRMADWFGFLSLLQKFASLSRSDVVGAQRYLGHIMSAETTIPRPPIDAGDAVSLMTIHAAKGLEWPIVFVPNLSAPKNHSTNDLCFDAELGVGFKVTMQQPDGSYSKENTAIRKIITAKRKVDEVEEAARILYVALTRARDRLYLTSAGKEGNDLASLMPGLEAAGIGVCRYDSTYQPSITDAENRKPEIVFIDQLQTVAPQFDVIPVTGLVQYSICPRRFKYRYIDGHPGIGEAASANARLIGSLTHTALELDLETLEELLPFSDGASNEIINEALRLARVFRDGDKFGSFQLGEFKREVPVRVEINGTVLSGKADLVGDDYVLDYKTDSEMEPEEHAVQLWAYAQALYKKRAVVAYLRQRKLYEFTLDELRDAKELAYAAVNGIASAQFQSKPTESGCSRCSYCAICDERYSN